MPHMMVTAASSGGRDVTMLAERETKDSTWLSALATRQANPLGHATTRVTSDTGRGECDLNCPLCGLTITPKAGWLAMTHCPRCVARTGTLVEFVGSRLPGRAPRGGDSPSRAETATGR